MKKKPFKKKYFIYIIALLLMVVGSIIIFFLSDDIKLKDDLTVELNNKVNILSFINKPKRNKILTKNKLVDTSKVGNKKLSIEYLNVFKQKKKLNFTIKVVDTIKPVIKCDDKIEIEVYKDTLKEKIKVTDNSNEKIEPLIEGKYDSNTQGEYKVTVVAKDKSGNKASKKISVVVTAPSIHLTGYYSVKTDDAWYSIALRDNDYVEYEVNPCHGMGCGLFYMDGRYKLEGDKLTLTLDHNTDDTLEREESEEKTVMELTVKDDKTIQYKDLLFTYQEKQW